MLALDCGVFLGSKEKSGNVEVMNDFCKFQVMHLEAALLLQGSLNEEVTSFDQQLRII